MSEPSRETLLWAARRVIAQHTEPVRGHVDPPSPVCAQCRDDGRCGLLTWAEGLLKAEREAEEVKRKAMWAGEERTTILCPL